MKKNSLKERPTTNEKIRSTPSDQSEVQIILEFSPSCLDPDILILFMTC